MRKILLASLFSITIACIIYSCQSAGEIEQAKYMSSGQESYIKNCQNCHGASGEGLGELAPPLTDTLFLKLNKTQLACIIKNGSNNKTVVIHGKTYTGKMPAFDTMSDIDIAKVIVYITNSFGNQQGMYSYEQVAADLKQCK